MENDNFNRYIIYKLELSMAMLSYQRVMSYPQAASWKLALPSHNRRFGELLRERHVLWGRPRSLSKHISKSKSVYIKLHKYDFAVKNTRMIRNEIWCARDMFPKPQNVTTTFGTSWDEGPCCRDSIEDGDQLSQTWHSPARCPGTSWVTWSYLDILGVGIRMYTV